MEFANIDFETLDYPYLLGDFDNIATLREALEEIGEDIIHAKYDIEEGPEGIKKLNNFVAWTEDSVLFLNSDIFGGKYIAKVTRNPVYGI